MTLPIGRLAVTDMAQLGDALLLLEKRGEFAPTAEGLAHRRVEQFVLRAEHEVRTLATFLHDHERLFASQQAQIAHLVEMGQQEADQRLRLEARLAAVQQQHADQLTQIFHQHQAHTEQLRALTVTLQLLADHTAELRAQDRQRIQALEDRLLVARLRRCWRWLVGWMEDRRR